MATDQKEIRKEFEKRVKSCTNNDQLKATAYLAERDLDIESTEKLILQTVRGEKYDAIQYALHQKAYKLFIALLGKVDTEKYLDKQSLLERAIEATTDRDKLLGAVLTAYDHFQIEIDIHDLPDKTLKKLYNESWSADIIKRLYDKSDSFFIPRGQKKAKMQALIYYNTFKKQKHPTTTNGSNNNKTKHEPREGAAAESNFILKGFKDAGCTVSSPIIDWTGKELLEHLTKHISSFGKNTSVLFVSIMSHGDLGILFDKNGERLAINEVVKKAREKLPQHIPLVFLIQSCQGDQEPSQSVTIQFDGGDAGVFGSVESVTARVSPIRITWPQTLVITATPPGYSATRDHFLPRMADQLRLSNGRVSFLSLYTRCSDAMAQNDDPTYSAQAPLLETVLRKDLILPKSLVYDKLTKVEKKGFLNKWTGIAGEFWGILKHKAKN